jgi:hypothetical protein
MKGNRMKAFWTVTHKRTSRRSEVPERDIY